MQASPAPHASTKATAGHDQTIAPANAGIDKVGFIDNSEGSFLRTGPRELGGDTVRAEPLPPATRVGKISPEAARELGRLSRLDQVLLEQLAKRGGAVVEQLGALLAKVPGWSENARLGLVKLAASDFAEAVRLLGKVSQHPDIEGLNDWVLLASRQVKQPSQLLDLEQRRVTTKRASARR